jgi:hypothetical protein
MKEKPMVTNFEQQQLNNNKLKLFVLSIFYS